EDGDVTLTCALVLERPDVVPGIFVNRQGVELGLVAAGAPQVPPTPGAVPDGSPAVCGGDPLVDDHVPALPSSGSPRYSAGRYCRSSSRRSNWSNCAQKSKATSGAGRGGRSSSCRTDFSSVPAKSVLRRRSRAASCDWTIACSSDASLSTASITFAI